MLDQYGFVFFSLAIAPCATLYTENLYTMLQSHYIEQHGWAKLLRKKNTSPYSFNVHVQKKTPLKVKKEEPIFIKPEL